jgi:hypothetical protein
MPLRAIAECSTCHRDTRSRPATLAVRIVVTRDDGHEVDGQGQGDVLCSPACAERFAARLIWRAWRGET